MLQQITEAGPSKYNAALTATAFARPETSLGYATPSGGLMGGMKTSLGCACDSADANQRSRMRAGPGVREDYTEHEPGRLLGEREALGAIGSTEVAAEPEATNYMLAIAGVLAAAFYFSGESKKSKRAKRRARMRR